MTKILVAMSGGVDSAVTASLLRNEGLDVVGATMKLYCPGQVLHPDENGLMIGDDIEDAKAVARRLGIRHMTLDCEEAFRREVVSAFIDAYEKAKTPNPCVICNRSLKFGLVMDTMRDIGADLLATGHYARVERDSSGRYLLRCAVDPHKDQTYVLYMLTQQQLSHVRFPLGQYTKADVRRIAAELGFKNAQKSDSQDICFIPDGDYAGFIQRYTGRTYPTGDFIDPQGNILGTHRGVIHYTIGQRKGLGIALGKPAYVCEKNAAQNTVTLSDNEALFSDRVLIGNVNYIPFDRLKTPMRIQAKIRYNMKAQPAVLEPVGEDSAVLIFDQPQRAITPGQSAVLYDGEYVVGGGIIR